MNATMNWADALGEFAAEVKAAPSPRDHALDWASKFPREYAWITTSTFDFAGKMRDALNRYGNLTPGQMAAVQRCMERDNRVAASEPVVPSQNCIDLSKVPAGLYAVPGGDTRLKVRIEHGESKWHGWVFVKDGAEYGQQQRYGTQRPGQSYQGKIMDQLRTIAQDPKAASAAYGRLVGRCGVCGKRLENEASIEMGIGPICAGKF